MHRFLFKCLIFFALLLFVFLIIGRRSKESEDSLNYMAAIADKHKRLNAIKPPRIIFAGGSNLAFGLNSRLIEDSLHFPVTNMGLHGRLGLDFMLKELKESIAENDIVFLSIEYFLSTGGDYEMKLFTSQFFPDARKYFSEDYLEEVRQYLKENREKLNDYTFFANEELDGNKSDTATSIYMRTAFDQYGDVVSHLGIERKKNLNDRSSLAYRYWEGIEVLNEFSDFAKRRNVTVFYLFPAIPISEYQKNEKVIKQLEHDLERDLKIEMINKPEDLAFPDSLFFDTIYHLTKEGREMRTKKVLHAIANSKAVQIALNNNRR